MNEALETLKINATNGKENFCYINEKQLEILKELARRDKEEIDRLNNIIKENTILIKDENGNYQELNINPIKMQQEIDRLNEELGDANYTITQLHKVMDRHYVKKEDYDRLNNIINELEKWLNKISELTANIDEKMTCKNVLDKLKALKENNK